MEKSEKPLIIPENCPPKDYVINGFTKEDIALISLVSLLGAIAGLAVYAQNGNSIMAVAMFFLGVVLAVNIFRRDDCTENLINKVEIIQAYRKAAKKYEYQYVDIWSVEKHEKTARREKQ